MISYGDIPLSIGDGELHALMERGLDKIGELREFQDPEWTGLDDWRIPEYADRRHPPLYRLYWPRGASRWGEAHFLATEEELDAIRGKAYTGDSRGLLPLNLKIDDGTRSITAAMYMVPPRPLFQIDPDLTKGKNLYLLTLVDERYWWWRKSAQILVEPGVTTWESLYADVASALGITITVDTIPAEYLRPPVELQDQYFYLPPMLDAIAYSVGQRIVRSLDGTVYAQNASTGIGRQNFQYDLYGKDNINFGGHFRLDRTIRRPDLPPLVPGTVRTVFPQRMVTDSVNLKDPCSAAGCVAGRTYKEEDLVILRIPEYSGRTVMRGYKIFHSTAVAWLSNLGDGTGVISNSTTLQELNDQLARDWYTWQLGYMSQVLAGIVPWNATEAEGASDYVEWEATPNKMRTFVMRETFNDLAFKVYHFTPNPHMSDPYSSSGSSSSSSSSSSGSSASGGGTVIVGCNDDPVPDTLHVTITYGSNSVTVPIVYDGTAWTYDENPGGEICAGALLFVRAIYLVCNTATWFLEVVLEDLNGLQDYQTGGGSGLLPITTVSSSPIDLTTNSNNSEVTTSCGFEILYIEILP